MEEFRNQTESSSNHVVAPDVAEPVLKCFHPSSRVDTGAETQSPSRLSECSVMPVVNVSNSIYYDTEHVADFRHKF